MSRFLFFPLIAIVFLSSCNQSVDIHDEYADLLENHPYYPHERLTPEDLKKIPLKDRPDLAMQQDFLLTMDPALGRPAPERLLPVYEQIQMARKHPIPGIPGSSAHPWIERGPSNVGGRTRAIMFDPNDPTHKKVWAGGVTGGLWYNNDIDNPTSQWQATDDFWDNISITAIAADPTNDSTFYVSTGEGWGSSVSGARGAGIWKSIDAGLTWSQLSATTSFYFVNDLVVREENGVGVIYAGLRGVYYSGSTHGTPAEGLQRSTDGGQTFSQVLPNVTGQSFNYAVGDIEIGADNRLWVGTINSGNSGSNRGGGVILYSDNGINWTKTYQNTSGRRVKLACAPSDSAYVYAIIEVGGEVGEIKKTTDHGSSWQNVTEPNDADPNIPASDFSRSQAWIHLSLAVDPNDKNTLIAGGVDLFKSNDGGLSWTQLSHWYGGFGFLDVHADQQIVCYRPGSSSDALFGNDGGIYRSQNLNTVLPSFTNLNRGYNVTQFYSCAIHPAIATDFFMGGTQDNGTQQFAGSGINITNEVTGGDGGYCFIDQNLPQIQITAYVYNNYWLSTDGGNSFGSRIQNSNTGLFINPADYDDNLHILYSAKSSTSINRISDCHTSPNISSFNVFMGGTASHLRVSPHTSNSTTLFAGTISGKVYKITNANTSNPTSTDLTTPNLPAGSVSCIEVGSSENELLLTYSNYGITSVWYTADGGNTWQNKEGNLPDMPVRWALFNPNNTDEAILATEVGIWSTSNLSAPSPTWVPSSSGLANVRTSMLQLRQSDNEVIAATFGRGIFSSNAFGQTKAPEVAFAPSTSSICGEDTLKLNDLTSNGVSSWQWTFSPSNVIFVNGTSANSQHPEVIFTTSGKYEIILNATNSIGVDTDTAYVDVESFPTPNIAINGNLLYSQASAPGMTYQWYMNGNILRGETGSLLAVNSNGSYEVEALKGNCTVRSKTFVLNNIGLGETNEIKKFKVYPTPAQDVVNVEFSGHSTAVTSVQVISTDGKLLLEKKSEPRAEYIRLNISHLKSGNYILLISQGKRRQQEIIQKK